MPLSRVELAALVVLALEEAHLHTPVDTERLRQNIAKASDTVR